MLEALQQSGRAITDIPPAAEGRIPFEHGDDLVVRLPVVNQPQAADGRCVQQDVCQIAHYFARVASDA